MKSGPGKTAFYFAIATAGLVILYWLQYVLLKAFVALLIAIVLDALASVGSRFLRLPRSAAVVVSAGLLIAVLAGAIALLAVPLLREGTAFLDTLREQSSAAVQKMDQWKKEYPSLEHFLPNIDSSMPDNDQTSVSGAARKALLTLSNLFDFAADALMIFFLALFLAWNPDRWLQGIVQLGPVESIAGRKALYCRIGGALRSYLFTYGVYILVMGTLWSAGLWLIGIKYFLIFGVLGGLVEVAPYIGPFIGLIPPLLMALLTSPTKALYVLLLYAILHILEGYVLVPWLMHEREHLPAPIILLSLMACGALFGTLGILVAVPLGTTAYVLANELIYSRRKV